MIGTRHDFVWRHVPGTLCEGRNICTYLEHWEVRCSLCGEPECTLSCASPCEERRLVTCCEHCGKPERFNVLCPDCEAKACDRCGRVDCCCVLKPCSGHEVYGCPLCDIEVSP